MFDLSPFDQKVLKEKVQAMKNMSLVDLVNEGQAATAALYSDNMTAGSPELKLAALYDMSVREEISRRRKEAANVEETEELSPAEKLEKVADTWRQGVAELRKLKDPSPEQAEKLAMLEDMIAKHEKQLAYQKEQAEAQEESDRIIAKQNEEREARA